MARVTKRKARQIAKAYVAALLLSQDEPAWPFDMGLIAQDDHEAADAFLDEVHAIGARIQRGAPALPNPSLIEGERE